MDALARDLATGRVSRRTALRRFAGGAAGLAVPSLLLAEPALAGCPKSRKCGKKCCPKGMKCKKGKCKCKGGLKKCGKRCFDVATDRANCGSCGHACGSGETCVDGRCTGGGGGDGGGGTSVVCGNNVKDTGEACDGTDLGGATCASLGFASGTLACKSDCSGFDTSGCVAPACATAADCPQGPAGDCQTAVCVSGTCGFAAEANGTACDDGNACTTGNVCQGGTCQAGTPVTCTALDECHVAGVCDPATGVCSNPSQADGTPCAGLGTCQGGVCLNPCSPNPCNAPPPPGPCVANTQMAFLAPGICTPAGPGFTCIYTPTVLPC